MHWVDTLNSAKLIVLRENYLKQYINTTPTILQQSLSVRCAVLKNHKNGETAVYGYDSALLLVPLVSC